jgi:hypothetical protein
MKKTFFIFFYGKIIAFEDTELRFYCVVWLDNGSDIWGGKVVICLGIFGRELALVCLVILF